MGRVTPILGPVRKERMHNGLSLVPRHNPYVCRSQNLYLKQVRCRALFSSFRCCLYCRKHLNSEFFPIYGRQTKQIGLCMRITPPQEGLFITMYQQMTVYSSKSWGVAYLSYHVEETKLTLTLEASLPIK